MIQSTITREQELTVFWVAVILAVISLAYGVSESNVFWVAVTPTVLIGALTFFIRRPGSHMRGGGNRSQPSDSMLSRLTNLERLAKLRRDGALTTEEFEAEKQKLLKADP